MFCCNNHYVTENLFIYFFLKVMTSQLSSLFCQISSTELIDYHVETFPTREKNLVQS